MSDRAATVEVVTFGCRLNIVESESIRRTAEAMGQQNLVVINTCAVTSEAVRKARQHIRKLRLARPEARIVVTGCAAQTEPELFAAMGEVDQIIGNDLKTKPETWAPPETVALPSSFGIDAYERVRVNDIMAVKETAGQMFESISGHTRGFVQVQNGCDHRCTFCIIPFGRGNSRSVPMGNVVGAVRSLVENGAREVVLTGVDITSYGADLPGTPRLGKLVRMVLKHIPELERLRISSIDSIEVDPELMVALADEERLMPHLHLSLQAGDDLILKRMKRRHLRADAIRFCDEARRLRPDIVFGADIIAGFPTETEAMFSRSLDLIEECGLIHLHVFPFSPRKGTPAAKMPPVDRVLVKDRAARLRKQGAEALIRHLDGQAGRSIRVLAEAAGIGRAADFTPVVLESHRQPGELFEATVSGHDRARLLVFPSGIEGQSAEWAQSLLGSGTDAGYRAIP